MKPRTKYEKAVIAQSGHLRPLPTAPRRWAFTNTINHYAFRLPKGRTTCMDCGHSWIMSESAEICKCPNCKAKLEVKETYTRKCQQKSYFNVITTCGEYQILRIFLLIVEMRKGFKASPAFLEIGQYWIALTARLRLSHSNARWDCILTASLSARQWRLERTATHISTSQTNTSIRKSRSYRN